MEVLLKKFLLQGAGDLLMNKLKLIRFDRVTQGSVKIDATIDVPDSLSTT